MQHSNAGGRLPRRWPVATVTVLAVTAVLTVLQYPFPEVRLALWRDADALASGQWWRLVTPLFVQYDAVWQIVVVFAGIAGLGVLAERIFGHGWWLLLYLGCGVVGQAFGYLWEPPDAGASVAGAGLLGAVRLAAVAGRAPPGPGPRLGRALAAGRGLPHREAGPARPAAAGRLRPGRAAAVAGAAPPRRLTARRGRPAVSRQTAPARRGGRRRPR